MPTSHATIETDRAGRYLAQLCDHLDHLPQPSRHHGTSDGHAGPPQVLNVHRAEDQAVVTFVWGTCTLEATSTALHVRVDARDDTALAQAEALLEHRIQTIGTRERFTVDWQRDPPRP